MYLNWEGFRLRGDRANNNASRFTLSGLASMHKPSSQGRRSTEFWLEGVKILDTCKFSTWRDCNEGRN